MNFFIAVICITSISQTYVESAKILAVFPFPGPSQYLLVQPYLKALARKGHEVTVINAFPQKQPLKNYRDVLVPEVHENYAVVINEVTMERNKWEELKFLADFVDSVTVSVLKNSAVQKLLKTESFDLVIVEALRTDALYSFARHFNAPLIGVSTYGTDFVIDELMGNMSPLAYTPIITADLTERMTYVERLKNVILTYMDYLYMKLVHLPDQQKLLKKYMPHIKEELVDIRTNFSLMLLNQHFSLSFPRPYVPNMIEIGGFQIDYKPQTLPKDIMDFLGNSTEDVIYFSMGSNLKSKDFPANTLKLFCEVFAALPYKILWKFEDSNLSDKPKNVFISTWFPQSDILAHSRVKLFISHGGLLSSTEASYHGKPILGLPLFFDQQMNIRRAIQSGYALGLKFETLNSKELKSSILEIMNNPKYIENAERKSSVYHDQPIKPLDLAIYWTEYVLRHKGAVHLQNPAQKMNFLQKHSIDTVGVLIFGSVLLVWLVIVFVFKLIKFLFNIKLNKEKIH